MNVVMLSKIPPGLRAAKVATGIAMSSEMMNA
jgi:hypothetical protein